MGFTCRARQAHPQTIAFAAAIGMVALKTLIRFLAGLSAAAVFFSSAILEEPYKEVVEKLDSLNNEEGDITPLLPQKLSWATHELTIS